ncbi:AfsR/SARP family transcriptional regulator [Virgisporangium aurantiacum]|uniref:SARP family transcriptional regulator n=1 Tax=Virgisporangium aurantiacum TaxID=175570 RepID=A0A8J3Z6B6_9ACTN|nr:BTAD domain-containing putative transcriptional regulator [Virgisporangium aurantiacum]GIJ57202.1 SARP family transcriptional regulator [Virgisporangium aurantiacum]
MQEHRVLGSVDLVVDGADVDLGPPRQRCVLAALYLSHGEPLSAARLIERVWGEEQPLRADEVLHTYVSRLRRILRRHITHPIERDAHGYRLAIDRDLIDCWRFQRLLAAGRDAAAQDAAGAAELYRHALALWRGEALTGVSGSWAARARDHLERLRLAAWSEYFDLELRAGRHADVVDELTALTESNPDSEPLVAQLMLALCRTGRRAEALTAYRRLRTATVELHGLEPGEKVRALKAAILRDDPDLHRTGAPPRRPAAADAPVPAQLPLDPVGFVGRRAGLAWLDEVAASSARHPTSVVIAALSGAAGTGKTTLAVHWGHRVTDRFPDGQLCINLRGFDPAGPALAPSDAIRRFLDALGVPPSRIPSSVEAQADLYRSLLAGRRMLVLLDNARDAQHARPLLPGAPGCVVVVTSRDQLAGLVATDGARPLPIGPMTAVEARQLLTARLGPARTGTEPRAVDDIVDGCARLPLALAIAAARALVQPDLPLSTLAAELGDRRHALDALSIDGGGADVRAVFSWSYHALSTGAARLFRLLGLHPGPDTSAAAAASLYGGRPAQVHGLLAELHRAHLITTPAPGRFAMAELLQAYAMELVERAEPDTGRSAATRRLLDHYLHTADAAMSRLDPHRHRVDLDPPASGVTVDDLADAAQAHAWLAAEHQVLVTAVHHTAAAAMHPYAWQLAAVVGRYLDNRGDWHAWIAVEQAALSAAEAAGDRAAQAYTHRILGRAYAQTGAYPTARTHYDAALRSYGDLGDRSGAAAASFSLACALHLEGRFRQSVPHALRALELYLAAGNRAGEARSRNLVGYTHAMLGDYHRALAECEAALAMVREMDDRYGQAATLDSIGYIHHHLGDHAHAVSCYRRSLALYRAAGDRFNEADVLNHLGDAYTATGRVDRAADTWRQALRILDELDHPTAEDLRAKLRARS